MNLFIYVFIDVLNSFVTTLAIFKACVDSGYSYSGRMAAKKEVSSFYNFCQSYFTCFNL